jgi:phenylacetate-CoA ligase
MNLEDLLYPSLGTYERLSPGLKTAVGTLYRHLPKRVRLGRRYEEFRALAEQVEQWSADQAAGYQVEQLRTVLCHAAKYSPFYSRRFAESGFDPRRVQSLDDLAACPYLTKAEIAEHMAEIAASSPPPSARLYMTTGGTTGTPIGFYLHKGISRSKEQAFLEMLWRRAGYFDGARLAVIRSRVTTERADGEIAYYDATRDWLMLSAFHLTADRLQEYLQHVRNFKPDILHVYPSMALHLAALLEDAGEVWPTPLKCLLAGSERLTRPQRALLEETFACPVYHWYGHRERAVLAGQGRSSFLLYFCPAYGYAELGPPDEDGLCEVIGTSFHNLAMPLIRYRTGDYVLPYNPSTDGQPEFPWLAVSEVRGRGHEFLIGADGRKIPLTPFNLNHPSFRSLYAVQFFQQKPGHVELRYIPSPRCTPQNLKTVKAILQRKLGDDFELSLRRVDRVEVTQRGKGRWLVSELTQADQEEDRASRRAC